MLPTGKIDQKLLKKLLKKIEIKDKSVILGSKIGEDAAVIKIGKRFLALSTDPITLTSKEIGWYVVHINANDVATRGMVPRWFLISLLLPKYSTKKTLEEIFNQILIACKELNVSLVGGHTEVTEGIENPIAVGFMIGECGEFFISSSGAKVGDLILLTKGIAIEGTAILAREKEKELLKKGYKRKFVERCKNFVFDPGISIVKEALLARNFKVNAMHDITEGGILAGAWEIAVASGVEIEIYEKKVFVFPETKILSKEFGLNPFSLISSGALLITVTPKISLELTKTLEEAGIKAWIIGSVKRKAKKPRILWKKNKRTISFDFPLPEELTKLRHAF